MTAHPHPRSFDVPCPFTRRQLEAVQWLAEGKSAIETAIIMRVTQWCVQRYLADAKNAAGACSGPALVATALRRGWIQ